MTSVPITTKPGPVSDQKARSNKPGGQYENLLEKTGGFGRYQWVMLIPYSLINWVFAMLVMFMVFGAVFPSETCAVFNSTISGNESYNETICKEEYAFHSLAAEWDLNTPTLKYIPSVINTIQTFGLLVGPIASGLLSDRFGRRKMLIIVLIVTICLVTARGFSVSWQMFAGITFLLGCCGGALLGCSFVYFVEHCVARRRILFAIFGWLPGCILVGLIALLTENWRSFNFCILVLLFPALAITLYLKPSPKWCMARQDPKSALAIFEHIAKFNRIGNFDAASFATLMDFGLDDVIDAHSTKTYSYWHLFYSKKATMQGLTIMAGWANGAMVYYGIAFGMAKLAGNIYINYLITQLIIYLSFLAVCFADIKFRQFGRRPVVLVFTTAQLVSLIFTMIANTTTLHHSHPQLVTAITLLGLIFCQIAWIPLELILAEFYPTEIRTLGYSANNFTGRVMMLLAPQMMHLMDVWKPLPFIIMTVTTTILLIFHSIYFPETKNCELPDLPTGDPLGWCKVRNS